MNGSLEGRARGIGFGIGLLTGIGLYLATRENPNVVLSTMMEYGAAAAGAGYSLVASIQIGMRTANRSNVSHILNGGTFYGY